MTAAKGASAKVQRRLAAATRRILACRPSAPVRSDEALAMARPLGRP